MLVPATFSLKVSHVFFQLAPQNLYTGFNKVETRVPRRRKPILLPYPSYHHLQRNSLDPRSVFARTVLTRVSNDGGSAIGASSQQPTSPVSPETALSPQSLYICVYYVVMFIWVFTMHKFKFNSC